MFSKKKTEQPTIDKEQLELIQNAQKRVAQKRRLYIHFVIFLIGTLFLISLNLIIGFGSNVKVFEKDWFVSVTLLWLCIFIYHLSQVYVAHKFMGKSWEQKQINKLVAKQEARIEKLKHKFEKEETHIAQSNVYNLKTTNHKNITIIVAASENNAIGKNNDLIWHLSHDLKRFKTLTNNHHIIMGRKTFESFPKPLPNRTHIVISRQEDYKVPKGVIVVSSLQKAIAVAKHDAQPFIIGGGEIYKQAMHIANKIELTRVHGHFEADTFFPEIDPSIWKETANTFHKKDEKHKYEFSFITYKRLL